MTAGVRLLRSAEEKIKMEGRLRNEKIRENLELKILEGKLTDNIVSWYGHILRLNKARIVKKSFEQGSKHPSGILCQDGYNIHTTQNVMIVHTQI